MPGTELIQLAGRCRLGRYPDNDVVVASERASRWHAVIIRMTMSEFRAMDLDTKNGKRMNGDLIFDARPLRNGDIVTIGGITC